jgi:hypothetical protein
MIFFYTRNKVLGIPSKGFDYSEFFTTARSIAAISGYVAEKHNQNGTGKAANVRIELFTERKIPSGQRCYVDLIRQDFFPVV